MNEYIERIHQVTTYIEAHISEKLTLDKLAAVSNFSKYHFSRVFTAVVGITPAAYIVNERLKLAVRYLRETDKSMLEISLLCGYESVSHFNASFKKQFDMTPGKLRKILQEGSVVQDSKISQFIRNITKEQWNPPRYDQKEGNHFLRRIWNMNISVTQLPPLEVAYVRHVGSYLETYHAWQKLGQWAHEHQLYPPEQYFIGISLDDPNTTEELACRYDACVTLPAQFIKQADAVVQFKQLPGGLYGKYVFYDTLDKFAIAYQSVFGQWLPNSEYEPDDRDCLEFCMNDPSTDPEGKAKVDLYIPIRKRA